MHLLKILDVIEKLSLQMTQISMCISTTWDFVIMQILIQQIWNRHVIHFQLYFLGDTKATDPQIILG